MTLPTVSVVMATYRRRDRLPRVLDALLADPDLTEAVVVVDGSDDGSLEYLRERARSDPRIVPVWQENGGASRAQQTGVERARGDVLLMFDDDQIAGPNLAGGHARRHEGHTRLVVVGYVPPPTPGPGSSFVEREYAKAYAYDCDRFLRGAPVLDQLWGGNLSIRREDMVRIGWANPAFPHRYHYDWEFGLRCIADGMVGVYDPDLSALHEYERTSRDFAAEAREQGRALRCLADLYPERTDVRRYGMRGGRMGTVLRLARRRRAASLMSHVAVFGAAVTRRLGREGLEELCGDLLWHAEAQRGAIEEHRRIATERV